MHIGIIIPQSRFFGGGPRVALELARELRRKAHRVTVYTFRHVEEPGADYTHLLDGIPVVSLPENFGKKAKSILEILRLPGAGTLAAYKNDHLLARALANKINPNIDALLPQSNRISVYTAYYFRRKNGRVPTVWQMNDLVTHTWRHCFSDSWSHNSCGFLERLLWGLFDHLERRYLKSVDEISVLAEMIKKLAREWLDREATVIRTGVNLAQFAYVKRTKPKGRRVTLMCHAQFFRHRRFEDAIDALVLLREENIDCELLLSGDSDTYRAYRKYKEELAGRAREKGVREFVAFPGRVSEEDFPKRLYGADIFLFPHVRQSWGLVPFEAMATGLPVVAANETGASEVLADHETALLVPPRQPEAIARAAKELVNDAELYERVSARGAEFVAREITWERFAEGILALIEKHRGKSPSVAPQKSTGYR